MPGTGAIYDFDVIRFGGPTEPIESTVTVQTTKTRLLKNNPDRVAIYMTNNNASEVFWSLKSDLTIVTGFAIGNGIVTIFQVQNDGALCGRELWGIAPAGPVDIEIIELVRLHRER